MIDFALCANYKQGKCPPRCFRAEITERERQRAKNGEVTVCTLACFEGTSECKLKQEVRDD